MRKIIMLSGVMALTGCVSDSPCSEEMQPPVTGMANPASVYCRDSGGILEIRDSPEGQTGYCVLPSGEKIEEWDLFRRDHK
ncbi:DUF333 domain-containing protein [Salmonella enterica subsp. enterica serovar Ball]|nr:DUF333 domain-containing protein [Salmonella enterica subsp. enterica serovar Minnesota]EDV5024106.1 DUF333 domain-containing protein [Salmonella enterica subsp. enterica serovar Ball]EGO7252359.1 DUF333 domain-containing protein [Salmonella enterica]